MMDGSMYKGRSASRVKIGISFLIWQLEDALQLLTVTTMLSIKERS